MEKSKNIREWRAEEIAKKFLLKSDFSINIENYQSPIFDFLVRLKDKPEVRFAVEVKTMHQFNQRMKRQFERIDASQRDGDINIPVFIFKINDEMENGEFDYLVYPSEIEHKLEVKYEFEFQKLTNENFSKKMKLVLNWFSH